MNKMLSCAALVIGAGLIGSGVELSAGGRCALTPGETEIFFSVPDESPFVASSEGIAADWVGNIYVSNRIGGPGVWAVNEILKISPWGAVKQIAELGPAAPGSFGVLGLTCDWMGNVYAAFPSMNEKHGVWKVYRNGYKERLSGSENIIVPNALTLDWYGNLYVSDSYPAAMDDPDAPGLIWRYGKKTRRFEIWTSHLDLAPFPFANPASPPPPNDFPGPGANGVAFVPPNSLYVANHEKSLILHILIACDGSAGEVTRVVEGGPPSMLFAPDGLSADRDGNLYAAMPLAGNAPFPMAAVLKIDPRTGDLEPLVAPVIGPGVLPENFEVATSLVFGGFVSDRECLYVANMGLGAIGLPPFNGAIVTRVGVGVRGIPLQ